MSSHGEWIHHHGNSILSEMLPRAKIALMEVKTFHRETYCQDGRSFPVCFVHYLTKHCAEVSGHGRPVSYFHRWHWL